MVGAVLLETPEPPSRMPVFKKQFYLGYADAFMHDLPGTFDSICSVPQFLIPSCAAQLAGKLFSELLLFPSCAAALAFKPLPTLLPKYKSESDKVYVNT